jgi:hypothetical protein
MRNIPPRVYQTSILLEATAEIISLTAGLSSIGNDNLLAFPEADPSPIYELIIRFKLNILQVNIILIVIMKFFNHR